MIEGELNSLTDLPRIGDSLAEELRKAGYNSPEEVLRADPEELVEEVEGIGPNSVEVIQGEKEVELGRPSLLDEYQDAILEAAKQGMTFEGIARIAGIGVTTLHQWRNKYPEFDESLKRARAKGEKKLIEECSAEFVLESAFDYTKSPETEINMDQTISVDDAENVTADFVTYDQDSVS